MKVECQILFHVDIMLIEQLVKMVFVISNNYMYYEQLQKNSLGFPSCTKPLRFETLLSILHLRYLPSILQKGSFQNSDELHFSLCMGFHVPSTPKPNIYATIVNFRSYYKKRIGLLV